MGFVADGYGYYSEIDGYILNVFLTKRISESESESELSIEYDGNFICSIYFNFLHQLQNYVRLAIGCELSVENIKQMKGDEQ